MKRPLPAPVALQASSALAGSPRESSEGVHPSSFGKTRDGTPVDLYTLTNDHGLVAKIITFGATVTELHAPDKSGKLGDVVLGFDNLLQYETESPYFGCIAGRHANRIAFGKFKLDGEPYALAINDGPNHLHGGKRGFDKYVWTAELAASPEGPAVKLTMTSPDGDEGYPGALSVTVLYTLTHKDELCIDYQATTDKPTIVNLTHHSYWNLSAGKSKTVLDEVMTIHGGRITAVGGALIPTGELKQVKGTPWDFTEPIRIGEHLAEVLGGYDHNYALNKTDGELSLAARAHDRASGRVLTVYTTEPGLQFYTGNFLDGTLKGKAGAIYGKHAGFCLEAQHFPDAPNHPRFASTVLRPGQVYVQTTIHRFSVE